MNQNISWGNATCFPQMQFCLFGKQEYFDYIDNI